MSDPPPRRFAVEIVWHRDGLVMPSNGLWQPGPPPWFVKLVEVVKGWGK